MTSILEIRQVGKSYGKQEVLGSVDLTVQAGEIISVLGPSGCGKSTLLQLIAGLQQPDRGEILLRGKVAASRTSMLAPEKRGINMVFQDYALWPHMTVFENIAYGMRRSKQDQAGIKASVAELAALLRLEGLEQRLPPQLSGGQQQRVAIARALATRPDLMLLDEPLSNLDMQLRVEMRTEMAYLFKKLGTTVFHVTHDPEEAFSMADRLVIMREGAIDQTGTPQQCWRLPASASAAKLLGAGNRLQVMGRSGGRAAAGGAELTGVWPGAAGTQGAEGPAQLLFRPDAADFLPQDGSASGHGAAAEAAASMEPGMEMNRLPVHVVHSVFEGKGWRVLARTADGQPLTFLHHRQLAAGVEGRLTISPNDLYLYPQQEAK
ncbi:MULTISPECIES: ABC transporter ATP-binding protein [unclassified Paenibacillus]|uniref:ABC transporter ATP-binding protein n=1 Tax=unclassified Paenibacillus TaxID=185978 RepID=UPI000956B574|nr:MULTISPECIES: ABC transporter ATP-binding protein [unclassified Paenibacillus]ASS68547.1 ABC transporter ATP-binding protein [Paenibacillus sp. RUD330]SIR63143.1 iron(III) transport system ATP-binding protein/putative spermidine/putrescine transport system ATP-binding protein [Paenibacillus sp. RU4X]SIR71628.1 iron(III) transport system ATP-binding protein/putative spermidine/putrescine transport system ATP-binding protein [Paenibacillus sp. RU4T]